MNEQAIRQVADHAAFIVAGFAFTPAEENDGVRVLNLENPDQAALLNRDGEMLETTMDDTTLALVQAYYLNNREFLEEGIA